MSSRAHWCLLLGLAQGLTSLAAAETLRLRADSWMPYNGDGSAELPGYAIEIVRAVFEPRGITIDYQTMPWGDALKAAAHNSIEAVVGANHDEAAGLVLPKEAIGLPRIGFFTLKQATWRYDNVPSLHSAKLAVMADYKYWPALDDYVAKHSEPEVKKFAGDHPLADAVAALQGGAVDVVAETSSVFAWAAKSENRSMGEFRIAYLHQGDPVFIAFAPDEQIGPRYAAMFDEGIRELRSSGALAKILARYGQSDWAAAQ